LKEDILKELIERAKVELQTIEASAKAQHDYATDSEIKSEGKYDTRAIEASYLAEAEARRVEELRLEIQILEEVDVSASEKLGEVAIGALVELLHKGQKRFYFLIPTAGGTLMDAKGTPVLVVSVFSPIGDAMLGLKVGDTFEVETPKETREYEILSFS